ncbi:MAG: ABC transporter permease [Acidobacteria bacterium]|nr:ABC transporter permease [Acidobacteriota bacterium]MBS1864846.1 ABC transporter permease [Acidobacteriota bacterium]
MNSEANVAQQSLAGEMRAATKTIPWTETFYWCVRRELWEHRAIYIGPLAAAGVYLLGFLLTLHRLPHQMRAALADPSKMKALATPYEFAGVAIMLVAMIVEVFYCVDAFQGERKDRSILFWKSLPVSDTTTVLSKAAIPFVILPAVAYITLMVTGFVMLVLSSMALAANGLSAAPLWTQLSLVPNAFGLLYHIVTVHILWYAPLYCWMLLISAWARRAAFVWAFLPPFCVGMLEKLVFGTTHFATWIGFRVGGGMEAEQGSGMMPSTHLTPLRFLSDPGLWLGWIAAVIFLALAVRIRRNREPN